VGVAESDTDDVAHEDQTCRADDDEIDPNERQLIDADNSQLEIDDDSGSDDDANEPGPSQPKQPRLDENWSWEKCGKRGVHPRKLSVFHP